MADRVAEIRARLAEEGPWLEHNGITDTLDDLEWACWEIERLTRERDAAYREGAEAMREALVALCHEGVGLVSHAEISALPIPEPK